jgi:hypothetical protein
MDFAATLPMLYAELNAAAAADLVFWSQDELTRYADLELSKLTTGLMLFVDAQDLVGIANQPAYDLAHTTDDIPKDTGFVSLIHFVWGGAYLTAMNMREVEARDANWASATAAVPSSWIGDWLASGMVVVYPQATQNATATIFCQRGAPAIATGSTSLPAPAALADLLHLRVLADARAKRSDAWMPEASALADQIADVLEKAFAAYYGSAL